jgi:hypothetical protein
MSGSELTYNERRISRHCRFDLGAGYPIGLTPDWVWDLSFRARRGDLLQCLSEVVSGRLGANGCNVHPTFSGSIALQRSLLAARSYLLQKFRHVEYLLPDPCIDILVQMSNELSAGLTRRVSFSLGSVFAHVDSGHLCREIEDCARRGNGSVVVLVSPDNPTGAIWQRSELNELLETCARCGSVLIVDHCFLLSGIHEMRSVEPVWNLVDASALVMAVWDTGKTVDLCGTKLGFILTRNGSLSKEVSDALSVIQYQLPDHTVGWIADLLASTSFPLLVDSLRDAMRTNQRKLKSLAERKEILIFGTEAGAFELICGVGPFSPDVGTIEVSNFRQISSRLETPWRRVALGRAEQYFDAAIALL